MNALKLLSLSLVLVAISVAAMSVRIFFIKGGRFVNTSVGKNKELKKRNIKCAKHEEVMCRNQVDKTDSVCNSCLG